MFSRQALIFVFLAQSPACAPPGGLDTASTILPIADATITINPICALSSVVRWTTDEPASSWVELGQDPTLTHRTGDDALVTEHEVIVVGMHAETAYTLEAVSQTADGDTLRSAPLQTTTGSLPAPLDRAEITTVDADAVSEGWLLSNVVQGGASPHIVFMADEAGEVVWYHVHPGGESRADVAPVLLEDDLIFIGPAVPPGHPIVKIDLAGTVMWEAVGVSEADDPLSTEGLDGSPKHDLRVEADGTHTTIYMDFPADHPDDIITQLDADGEPTWTWSAQEHLPIDAILGAHMNSVFAEGDAVYANSLGLRRFFRIDRVTGDIVWEFGNTADFAPDPEATYPWPAGLHSLDHNPDGTWMVLDNDIYGRHVSRVLMYDIDEEAMTSEIVWQYDGGDDDGWYSQVWGDSDLLDNGNVLITEGWCYPTDECRIIEVTPAGDTVWELRWMNDEDALLTSYAAERIPALLQAL